MQTSANENDHPDPLELRQGLDRARSGMLKLFPIQQKAWVAEGPLAPQIESILARRPEYCGVRAAVGEPMCGPPVERGGRHE
jgi:hypothetical protein